MGEYIQVFTSIGKKKDAEKIASILVEGRLAACVQILGPAISTFWWNGSIEIEKEWLCLIKSDKRLYSKLEKTIRKMHSYETPEIIATPIIEGSKDYLQWLGNELKRG